jgi:hypothetical protein
MRPIDADSFKAEVESLDAESNNHIYKIAMEDMLRFFVELIDKQPTIEAEIDRAALLRLCNEIEMIIVTVCDTGYTLQNGDIEAIMKRTKAIREEVRKDVGTDD